VVITLVIDGMMIVFAIGERAALLWVLHRFLPVGQTWALRALEFLLDLGVVGTVVVFTGFDLAKRIANAWRDFHQVP
jgi:hypothetical protein